MMLDRIIEMDAVFFALSKPYGRCSNIEWQCAMSLGYV